MAKIWFVKNGQFVHDGLLFKEVPFKEFVEKLGVKLRNYKYGGEKDSRIEREGKKANLEPANRNAEFVVVEADENDVAGMSWRKGFYLVYGVRPNDARKKLG